MLVVPQVVLFLSHGDMKLNKVLKISSDNTVCLCMCVCMCVCVCVYARTRVHTCMHALCIELDVLLIKLC
jgi:hypothetical protein